MSEFKISTAELQKLYDQKISEREVKEKLEANEEKQFEVETLTNYILDCVQNLEDMSLLDENEKSIVDYALRRFAQLINTNVSMIFNADDEAEIAEQNRVYLLNKYNNVVHNLDLAQRKDYNNSIIKLCILIRVFKIVGEYLKRGI